MKLDEIERQQPYFYWLLQIPGIGDKTIGRIFNKIEKPEEIFYIGEEQLKRWKTEGVLTDSQFRNIKYKRANGNIYSEYDKLRKSGISLYPFYHPKYPGRLRNIPDMPCALYVKGKLPSDNVKSIAIIGARNCSDYGMRMAEEFAGFLGNHGVQIISGMARGTDIWAAEIVLQRRSQNPEIRLICALPYPRFEKRWSIQWQQRYSEILRNADLVKVVCPAFSMDSYQKRNAWMVDHSALVIAVFSGQAGGTKNTIDYAEKQGKRVILIWDGREPRCRTLRQME